jgi:hypothetical protein
MAGTAAARATGLAERVLGKPPGDGGHCLVCAAALILIASSLALFPRDIGRLRGQLVRADGDQCADLAVR